MSDTGSGNRWEPSASEHEPATEELPHQASPTDEPGGFDRDHGPGSGPDDQGRPGQDGRSGRAGSA